MEKQMKILMIIVAVLSIISGAMHCMAAETKTEQSTQEERQEVWIQGEINEISELESFLDFSDLDELLKEQTEIPLSFSEIFERMKTGDISGVLSGVGSQIKGVFWDTFSENKAILVQIIIVVISFSVLHQFAKAFQNPQIAEISFYMVYLILIVLLMRYFMSVNEMLTGAVEQIMDFMHVLLPAFAMMLVVTGGSLSAAGFYEITLLIIYVVEWVVLYFVLPAVRIYVIFELLNHLTGEQLISRLTELLSTMVSWILKIIFSAIVGLNVVQGILGPTLDHFKRSAVSKGIAAIPAVGNALNSVSEILISSGAVIRSGVGAAALIVLVCICLIPFLQIGIMAILYKITATVVEPVSDKRISGSIAGVANGSLLLVKILLTVGILFFVTIAIVTAAAGGAS